MPCRSARRRAASSALVRSPSYWLELASSSRLRKRVRSAEVGGGVGMTRDSLEKGTVYHAISAAERENGGRRHTSMSGTVLGAARYPNAQAHAGNGSKQRPRCAHRRFT